MKKKIVGIFVDILLFMAVFSATEYLLQHLFHSERLFLELVIYMVFYGIAFGAKSGIVALWKRFFAKTKEER